MILRIEQISDPTSNRVRPYLVDAESNLVMPCQVAGRLEWSPEGCEVSITFAVDDRHVVLAESNPEAVGDE